MSFGNWTRLQPLAAPLRFAVFVEEQNVPAEMELDKWDALSVDAIAFDDAGTEYFQVHKDLSIMKNRNDLANHFGPAQKVQTEAMERVVAYRDKDRVRWLGGDVFLIVNNGVVMNWLNLAAIQAFHVGSHNHGQTVQQGLKSLQKGQTEVSSPRFHWGHGG